MEIWKDIPGYEGLYQISNLGKVKSLARILDIGMGRIQSKSERILKPSKGSHGYFAVALCNGKSQISTCIHRLMAEAFIPNPLELPCINHKDSNRTNNSLSNLEWVTYSQNIKHAYKSGYKKPCRKISSKEVLEVRALSKLGLRVVHLKGMYCVEQSTISNILNFKTRING